MAEHTNDRGLIEKAARIDECLKELPPAVRADCEAWLAGVQQAMTDRARARGQRPNFGPQMAKELLYIKLQMMGGKL